MMKNNDKEMEKINFDLNHFLKSISFALDFVEQDVLGASVNHSRRVAYIALRLAYELQLSESEKSDLAAYSIMHDNGLCEETLFSELDSREMKQLKRIESFKEHCQIGEDNVEHFPFQSSNKNIIKYHHENFDGSGFFGLQGYDIPLLAQIISLADFIDNIFHFERKDSRNLIIEFVKKERKKRYSAELTDAFLKISLQLKFWLDLRNEAIQFALDEYFVPNNLLLNWQEILDITKTFSKIVDSKSKFTARHTSGLMEKAKLAADFYGFSQDKKTKFLIAASLHDLGKLAIPTEILEKNGKLNTQEINSIRTHTYYTKFALKKIDHFENIREWGANHHEKLNGKGYPERLVAEELDFNSRLMACLDIFQALIEDRPYRNGLSFATVKRIMNEMADHNSIDSKIVKEILPFLKEQLEI